MVMLFTSCLILDRLGDLFDECMIELRLQNSSNSISDRSDNTCEMIASCVASIVNRFIFHRRMTMPLVRESPKPILPDSPQQEFRSHQERQCEDWHTDNPTAKIHGRAVD